MAFFYLDIQFHLQLQSSPTQSPLTPSFPLWSLRHKASQVEATQWLSHLQKHSCLMQFAFRFSFPRLVLRQLW